jgi:hypothetical protein
LGVFLKSIFAVGFENHTLETSNTGATPHAGFTDTPRLHTTVLEDTAEEAVQVGAVASSKRLIRV